MELALAFPYSLGLVAAFNPCGCALLPAYLSYFLGLETAGSASDDVSSTMLMRVVLRGIVVGLTLTAGFVLVFGAFGLLFETVLSQGTILDHIGYVTIIIGVAMVGLGVWMLTGREVNLRLPKLSRGGESRGIVSVFMFGISYAVVSLSCTIGLFIAAVAASFTDQGFADGVANFIAYGLGMGSVITFLTLALALARTNVVGAVRRALRWVKPVSGVILIASGVYVANYGWWELQILEDPTASNVLVDKFIEFQSAVSDWIAQTTPHRLGVLSALGVLGALLLGWREIEQNALRRRSVTAAYALLYLAVEFGFNSGDFLVLPMLRFIAGWPERIGNWFTAPLRFGVPGEMLFVAAVVWLLATVVRRSIARSTRRERETEPV